MVSISLASSKVTSSRTQMQIYILAILPLLIKGLCATSFSRFNSGLKVYQKKQNKSSTLRAKIKSLRG